MTLHLTNDEIAFLLSINHNTLVELDDSSLDFLFFFDFVTIMAAGPYLNQSKVVLTKKGKEFLDTVLCKPV